jgi:NAD-dependent dihydropyrimidine dehydrogenase PreA subunit
LRKTQSIGNQTNSTNLKRKKMAYVISDDCIACGSCIDECPVGAISEGDIYAIDPELCSDCGTCADACPTEAIHPA